MDFTQIISFGRSYVSAKVAYGFISGSFGPEHFIYGAVLMGLVTCLAASAYVVVKTVDAAVSFLIGYYAVYSGHSNIGD